MRLTILGALALAATAHGYLDTSPFFMFSTSSEFQLSSLPQLSSASSVTEEVSQALSRCSSEYYVLVSQPGVSDKDYQNSKASPFLANSLSGEKTKYISRPSTTWLTITDVMGNVDSSEWKQILQEKCSAQSIDINAPSEGIPELKNARLINLSFPPISKAEEKRDLANYDAYLASVIDMLPSKEYTVLYTTTPVGSSLKAYTPGSASKEETKEYEMESLLAGLLHTDLKRDLSLHASKSSNQTMIDGPLFDKYQFLGPGIFMGFTVGLILLSILYVGLSALGSLQVTYAAFDKEQGALAGKKAQ